MTTEKEVTSSQFKKVKYDSDTETLIITFNNGSKYSYEDVPEKVFLDLIRADSLGSFFIKNIKSKYKFTKIG